MTQFIKASASGVNNITTGSLTTTTGSFFLAVGSCETATGLSSVTDSKSNSYGSAIFQQDASASGNRQVGFRCENGTGGSGHTWTANYTGNTFPTLIAGEVTGALTTAYDSASKAQGASAGPNYTRATTGQAQADNVVIGTCNSDDGGTVNYASTQLSGGIARETDSNNFWTLALAFVAISQTTGFSATFTTGMTGNAGTVIFAVKVSGGSGGTSTAAESSTGSEAGDRSLTLGSTGAESSAGTAVQDRSVPVSGSVAESATGSEASDRAVGVSGAVSETSAASEAGNRDLALTSGVGEASAGATTQDRSAALTSPVVESAIGTTAQDYSIGAQWGVTESSLGTNDQDRSVATNIGAAAESSTGAATQDYSVGVPVTVTESSVGTTDQDYVAGAIWSAAESSAGTTIQDGVIGAIARDVAEASQGQAFQNRTLVPPAGEGASAVRRYLIQTYTDYFALKEKAKAIEAKAIEQTTAGVVSDSKVSKVKTPKKIVRKRNVFQEAPQVLAPAHNADFQTQVLGDDEEDEMLLLAVL